MTAAIVQKVWSFCNTLRDDGVGYGDYLEQLTYLLFLKMAQEYTRPLYNRKLSIPKKYDWESLVDLKGAELESHYAELLRELSKEKGILGQIFFNRSSQNSSLSFEMEADLVAEPHKSLRFSRFLKKSREATRPSWPGELISCLVLR